VRSRVSVSNFQVSISVSAFMANSKIEPGLGIGDYGLDYITVTYTFICRFAIFKLADGLKINDMKWNWLSFKRKNVVLKTSYQICLQNVEMDYLEIFAKC